MSTVSTIALAGDPQLRELLIDPELAEARVAAILAYAKARGEGAEPFNAAQQAWLAVRRVQRHLRAPYWHEQVHVNSGQRRSYVSPLGCVLGVQCHEFGNHSSRWPRTKQSYEATERVRDALLAYLESHTTETTK